MANTGKAISAALDRALSTYFAVSEKQAREEDRAEESKYREFYAKLQGNADARAAESHAVDLEAADLRIQALTEEAEARAKWFEEKGQSFASWNMMTEEEKFEMAKGSWDMAQELNTLQLETGRFQLAHSRAMAPLELQGAQLRNRNAALAGAGGGRKAKEPIEALQDQWDMYNVRLKSIQSRLQDYKNPLTQDIDWARVPKQLMESYEMTSQHMTELDRALGGMQGSALGLSDFSAGPGSSEGEEQKGAIDSYLERTRAPVLTGEEQEAQADEKNRRANVKRRKIVVEGPRGELIATDDDRIFERVQAQGGRVYDIAEVPAWAIGKTVEQWEAYRAEKERAKAGFALGPGGAGMMR